MPRKITVATVCQCGRFAPTVEDNVANMRRLLEPVWPQQPDIVCLPEGFATAGHPGTALEKALPVPGAITDAFSELAREHRSYIICPMLRREGDRAFNSAVILDRDGDIAGIYNKAQPVTSQADYSCLESGVTPGTDAPVFELDFGRVGIQICFDIEFPETWQQLEDNGAELVFWPSAYDGGSPLAAYAYQHCYYVVSSVRSSHSRIINPLGEELDHTGNRLQYAVRTIDMDYMVCHNDFHHGLINELIKEYGPDVSARTLQEAGRIMIECNRDDLTIADLTERFGLVSRREYIDRHRCAFAWARAGQDAEAQSPAFTGRQPYSPFTLSDWETTNCSKS